ncbi:21807_t:CDS:1 [Cetraspora pellucida]|uniref:21807_t:CDS:1 n=1 Tax=Cetraspora pellucida TaxID=1433469 RepID=A0A9N9HJG7_9GLOM|nr:21807_t:CDS:1 [Cetraspora pellucida]
MQKFSQVAYLFPSVKHDKLARKLIDMNKIAKYKVEKLSEKIYVEVKSETMPGLIYTTCVYGQPTDICCQCPDFLQSRVMCKHLHAAAFYIEDLHKQEQYSHLPAMNFPTYQESQNIRSNVYADKFEIPTGFGDDDHVSDEDNIDDENENTENKKNDNNDGSTSTSSKEILTYIRHILGSNTPIEVSQSNAPTSTSTPLKYNIVEINNLNIAAIYQQEIKEFLESTSKCLQELQNNLIFLQNLVKSKYSIQEHFNYSDQNTLLSHLHNIVTLDDFKKTQDLVNIIYKETGHHKRIASDISIIPLEQEKKQQQKPSYKS